MQVKECTKGVLHGISIDILLTTHDDTRSDMMSSIQITDFTVEHQLHQYQHDQHDNGINTILIDGDVSDINVTDVWLLFVANESRTFSTWAKSIISSRVSRQPLEQ